MNIRNLFPVFVVSLLLMWTPAGAGPAAAPAPQASKVFVATIAAPITPVTADYLDLAIKRAEEERADLLVLELDTPGGLDTSMRQMVQSILKSQTPVAVFVSPSGARAASAGVLITLAADIAAMAPGTNIGAAHPVNVGGGTMDNTMSRKVENDAAAYAKSLATGSKRNAEWAESAVRDSASLSSEDALQQKVIDLIASDLQDLLAKVDGMEIKKGNSVIVLRTKNAPTTRIPMALRHRVLAAVSDPTIAYILLMIGIYGIYFELAKPGAVFPGVVGGICLLLGFYALQTLSADYVGFLLILLSLILFFAEMKVQSHGVLAVGGILSMVLGSIMLFNRNIDPFLRVSWSVLFGTAVFSSAFFGVIISMVVRSQLRKVVTGAEGMVGETGVVMADFDGKGKIYVAGELWDAHGGLMVRKGDRVVVKAVEGMTLLVEPKSPGQD
ncbi:MAG: nodulation protein NfeD [Syntrophorhabdaceae bacterium]|nr:nodulation protein NfeD [Syntrophorhabdaceae bacterium]